MGARVRVGLMALLSVLIGIPALVGSPSTTSAQVRPAPVRPTPRPVATAAPTQSNALIPRAILFGNPRYARLRISLDGARIAYLRPDDNDVLQVWVRTIGQNDDHPVTADPRRPVVNYLWTFDSQK